jgi:prophage antirepressor-like protein
MDEITTTSNSVSNFNFDGAPIRSITRENQPWFVAIDVCAALGLKDISDAVGKLDEDEKVRVTRDLIPSHWRSGEGGSQNLMLISESGLFALVLRCRDAMKVGSVPHRFRKWVTSEVLPSVRKTGGYSSAPMVDISSAMIAAGQELRRLADYQSQMNSRLERLEKSTLVGVKEIKGEINTIIPRNEFPKKIVDEFVSCLRNHYSGKCPISSKVLIDNEGSIDWSIAAVDHYFDRRNNGRKAGWIVWKEENEKLKDPAYRARNFVFFQGWCMKLDDGILQMEMF